MENYNVLENKIESIFKELKITYEHIDLQDSDLNYLIKFNTYGRLKSLNSIDGFVYFHHKNFSMNFFVMNVYSYQAKDNIYELINTVNSYLLYGSFLIENENPNEKHIFYRNSISCGYNYCCLDNKTFKLQLDAFFDGLEKLFDVLKSRDDCGKK